MLSSISFAEITLAFEDDGPRPIIKSNGPLDRGMGNPHPGPKMILSNLLQYILFLSLLYVNHVYKLDQWDGNFPFFRWLHVIHHHK